MRVAVKDTSILIDLTEGDLLGLWFKLGIETHTTTLVLSELRRESQWQHVSGFVDAGLLRAQKIEPADMAEVVRYHLANRVSLADASGILLARRLSACLLSGDRRMRNTARTDGLEVRGVLWIFDELVEQGVLAKRDAADRLERICASGSRLPHDECMARLKAWRS
jgi:predicted nucleic acid-binding protein